MHVKEILPLWLIRGHSSGGGKYSRVKVYDSATY